MIQHVLMQETLETFSNKDENNLKFLTFIMSN